MLIIIPVYCYTVWLKTDCETSPAACHFTVTHELSPPQPRSTCNIAVPHAHNIYIYTYMYIRTCSFLTHKRLSGWRIGADGECVRPPGSSDLTKLLIAIFVASSFYTIMYMAICKPPMQLSCDHSKRPSADSQQPSLLPRGGMARMAQLIKFSTSLLFDHPHG